MDHDQASSPGFNQDEAILDPAIIDALPGDCNLISGREHGVSFWARTRRIDVRLEDGSKRAFFLKVMSQAHGKNILEGEYESMRAIGQVTPEFVPDVLALGTYRTDPDIHFLLLEFRHMVLDLPDPETFAARLSALHSKSCSPNGKFGFHVTTWPGNLPQYTDWEDSWEVFFAKSMRQTLNLEIDARGYDPEFDILIPTLFDKIIPRLLRPLETDGQSVKPSLVHGDLWYANAAIDEETGEPLIFDACCFYAHYEYEFRQWRPACNKFGKKHLEAYLAHVPKSPPEEDFDGRLDLYKLKFNTHVSALFPNDPKLREQMLGDLRDLKARYGE